MFRLAIVGRPNVGKSTLFNRLTGARRAIVGDEPGITRDRLYGTAQWNSRRFEVIDTGGIIPDEKELILERVLQQTEIAVAEADLVLLLVDARDGLTPVDRALNSLLRTRSKEYFIVVNKVDVPSQEQYALEFHSLGTSPLFAISAEHRQGIAELVDAILPKVPETEPQQEQEEIPVAIIGRPNVGKSSLLNCLLGEERAIVTDVPGTTRDAVDSLLSYQGRIFRLVDTAGIRRKGKTRLMAEKLSVVMARKNMERAQIVLLVIDPQEGMTHLDATIAGYAHKTGKSIIIVVNKWDLISRQIPEADHGREKSRMEKAFRSQARFLDFAPVLFVSAKTGEHVSQILRRVQEAFQARQFRVPTAELNSFFENHLQPAFAAGGSSRKFPVKYAAQVSVAPPTFVFFMRGKARLHFSTVRFLINRLRDRFVFYATPIRIVQRTAAASSKVSANS
ncbi:MAG: ribosome biogenesis GTPase Der [Acidobacteria bacterium]|nr:ribosome biogenesis GTPase Der [Acidobacteriota bacterium]